MTTEQDSPADAAQASAEQPSDAAPAKRRTIRSKKRTAPSAAGKDAGGAGEGAAPALEAGAPSAPAGAAAEPKAAAPAKTSRRRRTSATPPAAEAAAAPAPELPPTVAPGDSADAAAPGGVPAAPPARRRGRGLRRTAAAAEEGDAQANTGLDAPAQDANAAPPPKPARRTRRATPRPEGNAALAEGGAPVPPAPSPSEEGGAKAAAPASPTDAAPDAAPDAAGEHAAPNPAVAQGDAAPDTPPAGDSDEAALPARRKSRRGHRGGRGRRKNARAAQPAPEQDETPPAEDDAEPDAQSEADESGDAAPQTTATPRKGKAGAAAKPTRAMLISVLPGEEVEVALTENGQLLEYYLDMLHQRKLKGNIYKGVIHNIDTNLQAAFVSYGAGKNGFLQIDEVHPEYWQTHYEPTKGKKFPPIQKVLKAGQEVLVQVVKEPTGNKGAFLTTWISLAGRFLVLTPGQEQIGVSRKVEDEEERARLRALMNGIEPGQDVGVIVRTVSAGTTKTTLKNDLQYLKRLWRDIRKKVTEVAAPAIVYQEPGLPERAVRDYLTDDVGEIWVDDPQVAEVIRGTVSLLFPRRKDLVRLHTDARLSLWDRFNLRRQLEQVYAREVLLPSGGRLCFDQTEALMAIDINSGKISGKGNFEAMAHKTNMEAAEAIARHLRLRDIGGQVVIDFIEMRDKKHVAEVEKTLRAAMKNDRARHDVARMSSFGLLELVRQRMGSSALAISQEPCPVCAGTGMRRNIEWQALQALRELRRLMGSEAKEKCVFAASPELSLYLLNHKRETLRDMEREFGKCLEITLRP